MSIVDAIKANDLDETKRILAEDTNAIESIGVTKGVKGA